MLPALEKLSKILRHEQSQGCQDKLVIGGLASFADTLQEEAVAETSDGALLAQIDEIAEQIRHYADANQGQRAELIDTILGQIDAPSETPVQPAPRQIEGSAQVPPQSSPQPPADPALTETHPTGIPSQSKPQPPSTPDQKETQPAPAPALSKPQPPSTPGQEEAQPAPAPALSKPQPPSTPAQEETQPPPALSKPQPPSTEVEEEVQPAPVPALSKPQPPSAPVEEEAEPSPAQALPEPPPSQERVKAADQPAPAEAEPDAPVPGLAAAAPQPSGAQPLPHKPVPRKPVPEPKPAPVTPERASSGLDAPVTTLPGISAAYEARLKRLGIWTVGGLIYHFPHRYEDYRSLKPINLLEYGEETTIVGTIWETTSRKTRGGSTIVSSIVADASGTIEAVWFNQQYLVRQLKPGRRIVLSGKVDEYLGRLTFQSPIWEPLERELIHTGRLVPIYPLTGGITARWMRKLMKRVVDHWAGRLQDPLPASLRQRLDLLDLTQAIEQIHFPDDQESAQAARSRLSFDEFLLIQLGMLRQRQQWQSHTGLPIRRNEPLLKGFLDSLPFELTTAQNRCMEQILTDLDQPKPMSRMVQGDVGSGKTVVAAAAMLMAVAQGRQVAFMAPTEILAEQHYRTIMKVLAKAADWDLGRPVRVTLLTGGLRRVARREAYTSLASGETDIVVGTQALIQRHVTFKDLGLVIVDEQHRFGVIQRAALRDKGTTPHLLVMSATPIPRSLALTVYGDLEISAIDELPPGRKPIETRWLLPRERERAYSFVRSQVEKGRQAFVLYPLVEESDKIEAKAAVAEYERLQQTIFPNLKVGLMHGRLKNKEKDAIMDRFHEGEINILVSTSVIEVGIDVPNASVMMIEGADRFGLAQLHQFRGRVGRGSHKSYCLLLSDTASPNDPATKVTWERLKAIEDTQDGFALAEKDLELRGPGDFLGVRQSGLPTLRLASLSNVQTLEMARTEAQSIYEEDPGLDAPEHQLLAERLASFWQGRGDLS